MVSGDEDLEVQLAAGQAQIEAQLPGASATQQAVLDDNFVSAAELDVVANDVIRCGRDAGLEISASFDAAFGTMQFTAATGGDEDVAAMNTCLDERYGLVGIALAIQNALTPSEAAQLELDMIDCLAESGIAVDRWPAEDIDPAVESNCYDTVSTR